MSGGWYFHYGNEQLGPFDTAELSATLSTYRDPPTIFVWRAGFEDWKRAGDIPELARQLVPTAPPPFPPPPAISAPSSVSSNTASLPPQHEGQRCNVKVDRRRFNNFVARNWRGEYSLGVTYWVFGLFGNIVAGVIPIIISTIVLVDSSYQPRSILAVMSTAWFGVLLIAVWQLVAVWRSAGRRIAERTKIGKYAPWAGLARVAVVLGFLRLIVEFGNSGLPQLTEASRMAFMNDPGIPDYAMRIMRDDTEIEISGGIKFGLADDLRKMLRASPQIKVVHLNSIGGRIGEAKALFTIIRDRGLSTYTSARCLSACTLAFAAGRERWIHRQARLGFHSPFFPGMSESELNEAAQSQKEIFARAGFENSFVDRALSTPNKDMWTPSLDELRKANVVTSVSNGGDFAASGFGSEVTKEGMGAMLAKALPAFQTLKAKMPSQFAILVEAYHGSYLAGRTESEMVEAARSKFLPIVAAQRPLADDDVLVDLGKLYADQYEAVAAIDPTLCYNLASGTGGVSAVSQVPSHILEREFVLNERIIATASSRPPVNEKMTAPIWARVSRALDSRGIGRDKVELLQSTNIAKSKHGEYCRITVAFMREIANLRTSEAALLFREMWTSR